MEHTWSDLVERAKNNQQDAFNELYQNSYDAIYRTVKSMIRDDDTALDIVQDTFVKGFDSLSELKDPNSFLPWMKRIAANKARDWFKKKQDIPFSQLADDDGNEPDFEDDRLESSPEEYMDRNETARLVDEILSGLPDEQRIVIGMHYFQEMSVAEIAEELDISENTVKSRLNYGRKKIRTSVEELEKQGTKLHSLAPIPFLIWLFKGQMAQAATSGAPAAVFQSIMAKTAVSSVAAAGSTATGTAVATATTGSASASAGGGLMASVGAKIVAGVLSVTLAAGGIGAGVYFANRDKNNDVPAVAETDTPTTEENSEPDNVLFTDASATSPEELLTLFLEEKLIQEKGIYNVEQPYYIFYVEPICIDTVYDHETGEFYKEEHGTSPGAPENYFEEWMAQYETDKENADISGLYFGDIYDYDGDGESELLTLYGENGILYLELFDTEDNGVVSEGKLSFEELEFKYGHQNIVRYHTDDGNTYIIVLDSTRFYEFPIYDAYYRISSELKPISYMTIDENNDVATESFYDGSPEKTFNESDVGYDGTDWFSSFMDMDDYYGNGEEEILCTFYHVGTELNDFMRKYYGKDIEQIRAERGNNTSSSADE